MCANPEFFLREEKGDATAMDSLNGKIALVTGSGRGIGRGIALAYARAGADVALCSRGQAELDSAAAEIRALGRTALALHTDLTDEAQVLALFAEIKKQFGRLDLLVNNAAAFDGGPLDEMTLETWERVITTNLRGPFLCTREALRLMKPRRAGRIINIGSIAAHRVRPNSAPYATSKHGLWGLTQVTALEGREHGITCCAIQPGNTLVPRRENSSSSEDSEPMMHIDDVARVAVLVAALPPDMTMLETTVLPRQQDYIGRG
jgi:NAD(P)-dependent dehydrogenase (short-subunit alcohol dehydrogenase family)